MIISNIFDGKSPLLSSSSSWKTFLITLSQGFVAVGIQWLASQLHFLLTPRHLNAWTVRMAFHLGWWIPAYNTGFADIWSLENVVTSTRPSDVWTLWLGEVTDIYLHFDLAFHFYGMDCNHVNVHTVFVSSRLSVWLKNAALKGFIIKSHKKRQVTFHIYQSDKKMTISWCMNLELALFPHQQWDQRDECAIMELWVRFLQHITRWISEIFHLGEDADASSSL